MTYTESALFGRQGGGAWGLSRLISTEKRLEDGTREASTGSGFCLQLRNAQHIESSITAKPASGQLLRPARTWRPQDQQCGKASVAGAAAAEPRCQRRNTKTELLGATNSRTVSRTNVVPPAVRAWERIEKARRVEAARN
jgi:hypothetical protein